MRVRGAILYAYDFEYHQFISGPSVQEALVGTTAQGQLPCKEGKEECVTMDFTGNAVRQQDVLNTVADEEEDA
jgi:hypothetical protein